MALPKWTDERTSALESFVGHDSPASQATAANAAEELETSVRSVSSKLRKMGYDVELASSSNTKSFDIGDLRVTRINNWGNKALSFLQTLFNVSRNILCGHELIHG